MKRPVAIALPYAMLLILTGCAGSEAQVQASDPPTTEATQAPRTQAPEPTEDPADPLALTCKGIIGNDDGGLHVETTEFLRDVEQLDLANMVVADELSDRIEVLSADAEDDLSDALEGMRKPLADFVEAASTADGHWNIDVEDYKEAAFEVTEICGPYIVADEVKAEPTPEPVATSGDYGTDLEALGVVPDSVDSYREFFAEQVCKSDINASGPLLNWKRDIDMAIGTDRQDEDVVRLTAAYDCPDRMDRLDEIIADIAAEDAASAG